MRIAFFHNLPVGGAKRVVYYQIKYLSKKHDVDLYTIKSKGPDFLNFPKLQCRIYEYEFKLNEKRGPLNKVVNDLRVFRGLQSLHKKIASEIDGKNYDIVIVHPDKYTQAPFVLSFLKTKNIYYCHEPLRLAYEEHLRLFKPKTPAHYLYEKITRSIRKNIDRGNALHADIILTNSKFTKQNVQKYYKTKAVVCYPGIDTNIFKKRNSKKIYDLLFVGDKAKEDGYDLFQDIVRRLPDKIKVNIVSTRQKNKWISDLELSGIYSKSKLVLSLAINEPLGLIPLEAMACGIPVIAADEGGYKETIMNGKNGYLLPRSAEKISSKIQLLLDNTNLLEKLSINSIDYIRKNWAWEKKINKLENILGK